MCIAHVPNNNNNRIISLSLSHKIDKMYSLGTSFVTTDSLLSSLPTHGDIFPSSSAFFAAPVTIQLNFTCAFCETSFEVVNGKTGDMRQLEDIALEYFKRRVLKAEEESLGDASSVFPDDSNGTRYRKLLGSITLCDGCIFHCAKSEEKILRDQLMFLEKMTGSKNLEEVFADPWLDVKRLAFNKLKCQEFTIKEKVELMKRLFTSDAVNGTLEAITFTSTASNGHTSTTSQQILLTTVNVPLTSESDSKQLAICKSAMITPEVGSKPSSCIGSPKQDKDTDLFNDNDKSNEPTLKKIESAQKMHKDSVSSGEGSYETAVESDTKMGKRKRSPGGYNGSKRKKTLKKQVALANEEELVLTSNTVASSLTQKSSSSPKITPFSFAKSIKKSRADFITFSSTPKESKKPVENKETSDDGTKKSKSVARLREFDKMGKNKRQSSSSARTSPRRKIGAPNEKPKKVFKIGNHYMTDQSSSSKDSDDSDVSFLPDKVLSKSCSSDSE